MEATYLMKGKNGMLVRVPESKLSEWSKQQDSGQNALDEEQTARLRQEIRQKLGLK